jgi:acetylornithine deacetylase
MNTEVLEQIKEDEVIKLAKDIVEFPSFPPDETPVANYLNEFMSKNGIETELQEVEPGRFQVLGKMKGTGGGSSLMFNGHIDVDALTLGIKRDPFKVTIEDGRFYGQGIGNMKGGVAAMVMAAVALKRAKVQLKGDLVIACVVGELQGGVGTDYLVKKGILTDYAVVPEPSDLKVRTATAGVVTVLIRTFGKAVHVGGIYERESIDAVEKMFKVWKALKKMSKEKRFTYVPFAGKPGLPRLVAGAILGGIGRETSLKRISFIPDMCTIAVDIRTVPGQTPESVQQDIEEVLDEIKAEDPEFEYAIEGYPATYQEPWKIFGVSFMPPCNTPLDAYIVKTTAKNHKIIHGTDPVVGTLPDQMPGNDSGHLHLAGVESISYGPRGKPSPDGFEDQNVLVDDIVNCAKVMALTALEVCNKPKK